MTNFKGTKGKWKKHTRAHMTVISENGVLVANCGGRSSNIEDLTEEQNANTLLISKAPEMLDILEKIVNGYNKAPGEMWIPDYIGKHIDEAKQLIKESTEL